MKLFDIHNRLFPLNLNLWLTLSPFPFSDFMKEKKRTNPVLATVAKKRDLAGISTAAGLSASAVSAVTGAQGDDSSSCSWGADMPPAKRMRTGSVGSTSSVGSSS